MANHMSNNNDDQGKNEQEDQGKSNGFLDWRGFPNGPNRWQTFFSVGLVVALLVFALRGLMGGVRNAPTDPLPTNTFVTAVKEDRVKDVTYKLSDSSVEGSYWLDKKDVGDMEKMRYFTSNYVGSDSLQELMAKHPAIIFKIDTRNSELWETLIATILPTVIVILALLYFMNQINGQNGRAMNFGRAEGARTTEETRPKVKFADVAGIDEAVEELQEIKDFLSEPARYQRMGAKIPRGVLLVGPPGTGKTLLAKAVAGEAGVPFFSISGSDFVEMFVGVGASRVRDLFKQAKEEAPCIVFIDEIDAVGRQRGAGLGGGHDEREQTLNQLLVEMDGFADNETVILIAATNRPDILDPALLRPGRFDRRVTVDRPDLKGREKILRVHSMDKPLDGTVDFERIAQLTPGFSGADLANLMNEAALLAARRRKTVISVGEVEEAMERVMAGPERKSRVITERERRTIAYHESGHALVGHVLENSDPVHKISIIARGQALGYTMQVPEEDHFLDTRDSMLDQIAVLLGGRTAEELFCTDITTGASNDLERATKLARQMVTRYGMSEELGTQVFGEANHEVFLGRDFASHQDYSAETAKRIDDEVERIMREAHARAREVLEARRAQMDTMANVLLVRETVEGKAVEALLNDQWDEFVAAHPEEAVRRVVDSNRSDDQEPIDEQALLEEARAAAQAAMAAEGAGVGTPPKPAGF
ncbi:MAG: ATP-dependent zinc metalloprotease FtsH [Coriobacteriales bacterium]|nr:ATP-dependent zinc metalloprotease FtsH [Coriobacteriales bacterium]